MGSSEVHHDRRRERWLVALVVVGALGAIGAWMTWASLSVTATNQGNVVSAGTVRIDDDAQNLPLYAVAAQAPGSAKESCIEVTYTGTLEADVRLFATPVTDGDNLDLDITIGSGRSTFPDCAAFQPRPEDERIFSGTLAQFTATHTSFGSGLEVPPPAGQPGAAWQPGDQVSLRFELQQTGTDHVVTGSHSYVWEARNR